MNLSKKQKEIVESPYPKIVVHAAAASGKTTLITERVKFMLSHGYKPERMVVITFTTAAADEMKKRIGYVEGLFIGTIHAYALYLLSVYGLNEKALQYINEDKFDNLFTMVKRHKKCIKPVDYLIVDEAQDCSESEWEFFALIDPAGFFYCGDTRQCQPAGTKVLLRGGIEKNIENIEIGDDIVWYNSKAGHCSALNATAHNAIHKRVLDKQKRTINNEFLITIESESGLKTSYTENHRAYIKMRCDTQYEHLVYLMCDDNFRFRVGKILLRGTETKNGNPWRAKMSDEGCTKIWILKVFKTEKEARIYEQKISYKYQIPQLCWQFDKVRWTKEDVDYIYEGLDTYSSAKKCLFDHQLNIQYPMIDRNVDWLFNQKFASNATAQLYAINIIPEIMDCVVYDNFTNKSTKKRFEHIIGNKQYITTPIEVYGLSVEGETYVADGIVTHNCIYEWRDAKPADFLEVASYEDVYTYSLDENYRNGYRILNFAKDIITRTKSHMYDDSIPMRHTSGKVEWVEFNLGNIAKLIKNSNEPYGSWFVLARTNDQIESIQYILDSYRIPNITFKRGGKSFDELNALTKEDKVKVLTIHTAKGLEADNVVVIGTRLWGDEEIRLAYVAATRARENLYWVYNKKKKANIESWE